MAAICFDEMFSFDLAAIFQVPNSAQVYAAREWAAEAIANESL